MLPKSTVPENCSSFIVQYDTFVSYKNDNYIDAPVWLKPTAIVIDVKNGTSKGQ